MGEFDFHDRYHPPPVGATLAGTLRALVGKRSRHRTLIEDAITPSEERRERFARVTRAYGALPLRQREAIYLRVFVGLEYAQIAQLMQISHQSALNFVQRSLRRLEETSCPRPVPPFQCSPSAFYQACAGIFFLKNFLKKE